MVAVSSAGIGCVMFRAMVVLPVCSTMLADAGLPTVTVFPLASMVICSEMFSDETMSHPAGRLVARLALLSVKVMTSSTSAWMSVSAVISRVTGDVVPDGMVRVPPPKLSGPSLKLAPPVPLMVRSPLSTPLPVTSMRSVAAGPVKALSKLSARVVFSPSWISSSAGAEKVKVFSLARMVISSETFSVVTTPHPVGKRVPTCVPLSVRVATSLASGVLSFAAATERVTGDVVPAAMVRIPPPVPAAKLTPLSALPMVRSPSAIPLPVTSMRSIAAVPVKVLSKLSARVVPPPSLISSSAGAEKVKLLSSARMVISPEIFSVVSISHPSGRIVPFCVAPLSVKVATSLTSGVLSSLAAISKVTGDAVPAAMVRIPPPVPAVKLAPLSALLTTKSLLSIPFPVISTRSFASPVRVLSKLSARFTLPLPSLISSVVSSEKVKLLSLALMRTVSSFAPLSISQSVVGKLAPLEMVTVYSSGGSAMLSSRGVMLSVISPFEWVCPMATESKSGEEVNDPWAALAKSMLKSGLLSSKLLPKSTARGRAGVAAVNGELLDMRSCNVAFSAPPSSVSSIVADDAKPTVLFVAEAALLSFTTTRISCRF